MSNKAIRALLETRLNTWAAARSPALLVAWENSPLDAPETATYLRANLLPAPTRSADMAGALRTFSGVFQVLICSPISTGPGEAEGITDELAALFPLNLRLTSSLTLQVTTPASAAPALQNDISYRVPVSFQYRADT